MTDDNRPQPIRDAESTVGRVTAVLGSLVATAATVGILTPAEVAQANELGQAVNMATPLVAGALMLVFSSAVALVSMVQTRLRATRDVTPIDSPQDNRGEPLVRSVDGLAPIR